MSRFREAFRGVLARFRGGAHTSSDDEMRGMSESEDIERELDRFADQYSELQILPPQGLSAQIKNNLGITYLRLGEFADAERLFLEALELWPGCANACWNLAALYTETGNHDKAEDFLKRHETMSRSAPRYVLRPEKRAGLREKLRDSVVRKRRREK